jgi:hypothetical protein
MSEELRLSLSDSLRVPIAEDDLIAKMSDTEHNFIERKLVKDHRGWLKTAVAFANSCPIGFPGVLFVGVDNKGNVERHDKPIEFEDLQKSISARIADAWPPIYHYPQTLKKDGAEFVAVLIPGSESRPHFAGHSYIRIGPESKKASEQQFDFLIAQRSSKVRALQQLVGQRIFWFSFKDAPFGGNGSGTILNCNQFFVTIDGGTYKRCFPVDWVEINFEPVNGLYQLIIQH